VDREKQAKIELSRRRFLKGAAASAAAVGWAGPRLASVFGQAGSEAIRQPGSHPFPNLPPGTESFPEIEHVIIYMQENRSFDHYFGTLGRGDGFTLDGSGTPTDSNPDLSGNPVPVYLATETCDTTPGASQSWNDTHLSMHGGAMDGFVTAADGGIGSMQYFDDATLPFYWGLASTFVLCDRWFTSAPCQTFPNRRYLQAATSVGIVATDVDEVLATPVAPNGVIWERLNHHGISWKDYAIDLADILVFPTFGFAHEDRIHTFNDFLVDCARGTLPQVSIISPGHTVYSEESPADVQNGEAYSASIINAVMHGPTWERTVLFFTYDEHGGYYDHVPPPPAIRPDNIAPRIQVPPDQPGAFDVYGPRVPGFVISPYAKADYVSSVVHDHTSILKFIETKWNLGAMTYRDANADDLLDCLDFANPGFMDPPTLPEPGLPPGGSSCQPLPRPPTEPDFGQPPPPPSQPPGSGPVPAGPPFTG
jgi:phospholipase C